MQPWSPYLELMLRVLMDQCHPLSSGGEPRGHRIRQLPPALLQAMLYHWQLMHYLYFMTHEVDHRCYNLLLCWTTKCGHVFSRTVFSCRESDLYLCCVLMYLWCFSGNLALYLTLNPENIIFSLVPPPWIFLLHVVLWQHGSTVENLWVYNNLVFCCKAWFFQKTRQVHIQIPPFWLNYWLLSSWNKFEIIVDASQFISWKKQTNKKRNRKWTIMSSLKGYFKTGNFVRQNYFPYKHVALN